MSVGAMLLALALLPYGSMVANDRRTFGAGTALLLALGDAFGFAALVRGSLRFRTVVL